MTARPRCALSCLLGLTLAVAVPIRAVAADAGLCVNVCGNACYGKPAGCEAACSFRCMNARPAVPQHWGSIFIGWPPRTAIGWSYDADSATAAKVKAGGACETRNQGAACYALITFVNRCGVAVQAIIHGQVDTVYGKARASKAQAQAEALAECHAKSPTASCRIAAWSCSGAR